MLRQYWPADAGGELLAVEFVVSLCVMRCDPSVPSRRGCAFELVLPARRFVPGSVEQKPGDERCRQPP